MSWTIHAEGTPDQVRAEVHHHEDRYWRNLPLTERLLIHHVIGHAVSVFEEHNPGKEMVLLGSGYESGGCTRIDVSTSVK